jgi:flagellar basal body-associated protein FliL
MMLIIGIVVVVIAIAAGGIMFMRKGDGNVLSEAPKVFPEQLMPGQFQPFQPTQVQPQAVSTPQPIAAAIVAEPSVVQQWTDENGNTWRTMDNGTTLWWNGTDWQQA